MFGYKIIIKNNDKIDCKWSSTHYGCFKQLERCQFWRQAEQLSALSLPA